MPIRCISLVLTLSLTGLISRAQPDSLFVRLEQAVENYNGDEAISFYNQIFTTRNPEDFTNAEYIRIFELSHKLSGIGFAKNVNEKLGKFRNKDKKLPFISPDLYGQYFIELGYSYYLSSQILEADSAFRFIIEMYEKKYPVSRLDIGYSYNVLGLIKRKYGDFDSAIELLKKAEKIRIEELGPKHPQVGGVVNNIGLIYSDLGDFDKAILYYNKAIEIKMETRDPSVYLNYMNAGEIQTMLGNYRGALDYYEKAESILREINELGKLADLYLNMGAVYNLLKANVESYRYFQKSLAIYTDIFGQGNEKNGKVYQNLANVYEELGDFDNELKATEKAVGIMANIYGKQAIEVAPLYNNLGLVYKNHKQPETSLHYLKLASKIYVENGLETSEKYLNTLSNIAETYSFLNRTDSAIYNYNKATQSLSQLFKGRHPVLANSYNKLAEIYFKSGDYTLAGQMVKKSISANLNGEENPDNIYEACLDPSILFESYLLQGKLSSESGNTTESVCEKSMFGFQIADSILSVQRNFLFDKDDKINLARNAKNLTEAVLECFIHHTEQQDATTFETSFKYIEKSKNLVLLNSISEKSEKRYAGIPDSALNREEVMLGRINFLTLQAELEEDSLEKRNIQEKLFASREEYKNLVKYLEKSYPEYYNLRNKNAVPGLREIREKLDDETVVLSFFVSEHAFFRMQIAKKQSKLEKIPVSGFDDLLTGMRKGITLKLDDIYLEKAHQLFSLLIPDDIVAGNYKKMIVIPDGALTVLPFEALLTDSVAPGVKPEFWPFLLNKIEISYSPSLAIWLKLNSENGLNDKEDSFLAFAPVFKSQVEPGVAEADLQDENMLRTYQTKLNELWLAPLQASEQEILKIDSLFYFNHLTSRVFVNLQSSKAQIKQQNLRDFKFIHIATHGFIDKNNPDLSGLFFAPGLEHNSENILYTGEIYNLQFDAELITLSACETGLGKIAEGEGMLGFSRAFLYSGAKNLLLSLWKVDDTSTSEMMVPFYDGIIERAMNISESLHAAKLKLVKNSRYSHPYYWAPFVLIGS
ncbi:CHAT domain-containing protein [Maribellus maritimus]|uniref:CHAT domain-containing protein n=1 Tax=Maribellus maritimus TaxID=2870838 RepID=UPI001EEC585B|nr:CHAT domain-containing protein [Maribellus maritimus]MCG6186787.1 CHAT domain-containing protein [Maribellus maritimus]